MRIVLFGQAAFGQQVLAGLAAAGHELAAIYAPAPRGGRADPLAADAERLGLPLYTPPSYKDPAVADHVRALGVDLGVLAFVTRIIPPAVFAAPRHGSICFHPSLLPRYRGGSALAWQLIKGETRGGLTVFWTDAGIDTGPILLQREVEISPDDTAGSLYFEKIFQLGVDTMLESVRLIAEGRAPRIPQDDAQGTYDPLCTDEHARVRWSNPAKQVHDLIRGCDPQPAAHCRWQGGMLRLFAPRRVGSPDARARPGAILRIDADGLLVQAGEGGAAGAIAVGRMRVGADKIPAGEAAVRLGLKAGDVLADGE